MGLSNAEVLHADLQDLKMLEPYWREVWGAHFVQHPYQVSRVDGGILREVRRGRVQVFVYSDDKVDEAQLRTVNVKIDRLDFHTAVVRRSSLETWLANMKEQEKHENDANAEALVADIHRAGLARQVFMDLFRDSDQLKETMTAEDCREVFLGVLLGQQDLTRDLLLQLCAEYETSLSEVLGVEV